MNYLFIKDILSSPWQIDSNTLNTWMPLFRGLISGTHVEKANEPVNYRPYAVFADTRDLMQGYYADDQFTEPEADEPEQKMVVNVLPIRGILTKHDQDCGPRGTRTYATRLLGADEQQNVIGHILVIESGGGQAQSVAELSDAMTACKKPIVVWIDGMACSAAYYIASYAKEIIASRDTDWIGCIGTMCIYEGRKSKSEANQEGEIQVTIYADGSEEKNEEFTKAIDEFDFTLVKQRILNPINEKFKADVSENRPKVSVDQLKGRTYFAKEVVGTLIDSIGDFSVAMDRVLALANFKPKSNGNNQDSKYKQEVSLKTFIPMKKQYLNVNKVLNVEELQATEDGVFLNEEQLELVDNQIAHIDTLTAQIAEGNEAANVAAIEAQRALDLATTERDTARTELTNAISAFDAIDATIAAAETPEAKVAAIRTLLAAKPGTQPAGNLENKDEVLEEVNWEAIENSELGKLAAQV